MPPVSVEGASLGSDVPVGRVPGLIPDLRGHAGWKQDHTATPKAVHSGLFTNVSAVPKPESQNSTWHRLKQKPGAKWSCPHRPEDPEENETLSLEEINNVTLFMARGKKQICNFKRI